MTQDNDDANDMAQAIRAAREAHVKRLEEAKVEAAKRGKETFDLAALEHVCDTSHEGRMGSPDERRDEFEWKYYVVFAEVETLAEFACEVENLNRW